MCVCVCICIYVYMYIYTCIYAAAGERGARAHRPLPPRCAGDAAEDARVDGQGVKRRERPADKENVRKRGAERC